MGKGEWIFGDLGRVRKPQGGFGRKTQYDAQSCHEEGKRFSLHQHGHLKI